VVPINELSAALPLDFRLQVCKAYTHVSEKGCRLAALGRQFQKLSAAAYKVEPLPKRLFCFSVSCRPISKLILKVNNHFGVTRH
jgi:hypothetical protein